MKGEVDILGNFPIDTSLKKKAHSAMGKSKISIAFPPIKNFSPQFCYDINQRKNTSPFGFVKFCYFQPYLMAIPNSNTNLPTEQCMYTLCNGTTGLIDICFHLNLIRGMFSINLFSSFSVSIPLSMNVPKCIFNFYRSWWLGGSLIGG